MIMWKINNNIKYIKKHSCDLTYDNLFNDFLKFFYDIDMYT